ncbi:hypothetical protein RRG08_020707 [Elysia crispata]|uniref:Uncharacterized protein n=1 Tax=Elysia crispata TaxID=231223 RepID=A0AAE1B1S5_9GAST|nr:hypothetical protein RRG08_020707 [Elysia crispata]
MSREAQTESVTTCVSPHTCHNLCITAHLSQLVYHRTLVTTCVSPHTCHNLCITAHLSQLVYHRTLVTTCVSPHTLQPASLKLGGMILLSKFEIRVICISSSKEIPVAKRFLADRLSTASQSHL